MAFHKKPLLQAPSVVSLFILIIASLLSNSINADVYSYNSISEPPIGVFAPSPSPFADGPISDSPSPSPFADGPISLGPTPSSFPPPPLSVAGPQSLLCSDPTTKCYGKRITCPKQCPLFKPSDSQAKGCYIDCESKNCEALCKKRKPNCNGIGAACYDPRFIGGDGIMFYFHGKSNQHFTLVSDTHLQINARFIGLRPKNRPRDSTWIQALGLLFNTNNTFTISAPNKLPSWNPETDNLLFTYNNNPISLPTGHLSTWEATDSTLVIERTSKYNSVSVTLPGVVTIQVGVVPVTEEDDRIHKYNVPFGEDCFAHLEVQFKFLKLSDGVEGVLGQTYRPGFVNPVKKGVPMPVMGGEDKYWTRNLVDADCGYCVFGKEEGSKGNDLDLGVGTVDCSSKIGNGRGFVCRR